jgi:hypothetical protein
MFQVQRISIFTGLLGFSLAVLAACGPIFDRMATPEQDLLYTQAAATIGVQLTLQAGETAAAQLTQISSQPTPTASATVELPTATSVPSLTLDPSPTPTPPTATPTQVPPTHTLLPPTATAVPCNLVGFVEDISVPDGTQFEPNQYFTKTWRLKNVGTCTWQSSYDIVFVRGDRMDSPAASDLNVTVKPGGTLDLALKLRAPADPGKYIGYWQLRDNNGELFGLGSAGDKAFWVNISVIPRKLIFYDLAEKYCEASWSSASGALPCPGDASSTASGFVIKENNPQLETGSFDNEPALFVRVDESSQGYIQGEFPAFTVKAGDHFRAIIGCAYPNKNCYVQFELNYRIDGGPVQSLGSWDEKNEGQWRRLDIDMNSLRDKSVTLILRVSNNSDSNDDLAHWLRPRVVR